MPLFQFEARNANGELTSGRISAESVSAAIAELQANGWNVSSISLVAANDQLESNDSLPTELNQPEDDDAFLQALGGLLNDPSELKQAVEAVIQESTSRLTVHRLRGFTQQLEAKPTAKEFLRQDSNLTWIPVLVSASEFERRENRWHNVLNLYEARHKSANWLGTIFYCGLLFIAAFAVMLLLLAHVIYPIADLYRSFGLVLPPPTKLAVTMSEWSVRYGWQLIVYFAVFCLLAMTIGLWWRSKALTTALFGALVAGNSTSLRAMASFTRLLAACLALHAKLPDALVIAARGCGHYHFRRMGLRLASDAGVDGRGLQDSSISHNFPPNLLVALTIDVKESQRIQLLREIANVYDERAIQRRPWATSMLGPVLLTFVGFFIAFIVIAVFMPLIQLITSLT